MFGMLLRHLRKEADLSITELSRLAGLGSTSQARTYESKCYPPGWVLRSYAGIFHIQARELALTMLSMSDPDLYECLTGTSEDTALMREVRAVIERDE